jgi:serine/threonine protein kinase/tetratricopeptide (TPR) repeat protein
MDAERWSRVGDLFQQALELSEPERASFLDRACGADAELRAEVLRLLEADAERTSSAPLSPRASSSQVADGGRLSESESLVGQSLGPYRIVRSIGRGGMGEVYLAQRMTGFAQDVAIKLLARGLDYERLEQRFRTEIRVQAELGKHPGIASILDVGTAQGERPYFVMELVEGERIDRYCDSRRLDTRARLRLFRKVCDAVQYAHQRAVIHRDLKPSNILVKEDGTPVLIDFGIAKLIGLDAGALESPVTLTGFQPMTPEYASPEQVRGEPVTTASDVYALGVILFELLTGHRPYRLRGCSFAEIERAVCHDEPARPSTVVARTETIDQSDGTTLTIDPESISAARGQSPHKLRSQLTGDLDTIVLTALRKDAARRYATVDKLSGDIERYLTGLPIQARKDTRTYRISKFISRHRVGVATGVLLALALLGGIAGTSMGMLNARAERDRAEGLLAQVDTQRKQAEENLRFARDAVDASFARISDNQLLLAPHLDTLRRDLLDTALPYYRGLVERQSGDPSMRHDLAGAYYRLALIEEGMGDLEPATRHVALARRIYDDLGRAAGAGSGFVESWARCEWLNARLLGKTGHPEDSLASLVRARDLLESAARAAPSDPEHERLLSELHYRIGLHHDLRRKFEIAERSYADSLAIRERLASADVPDPGDTNALAATLAEFGTLRRQMGASDEALRLFDRALELLTALGQKHPSNPVYQRTLADVYNRVGFSHAARARSLGGGPQDEAALLQARAAYKKALEINRGVASDYPTFLDYEYSVARNWNNLANVEKALGHLDEARAMQDEACKTLRALTAKNPGDVRLRSSLASYLNNLGLLMFDPEGLTPPDPGAEAALETFLEAIELQDAALTRMPRIADVRFALISTWINVAKAQRRLGNIDEAGAAIDQAVRVIDEGAALGHTFADSLSIMARELMLMSKLLSGDDSAALEGLIERALTMVDRAAATGFRDPDRLATDETFEHLREHPRFIAALEKMRFDSETQP